MLRKLLALALLIGLPLAASAALDLKSDDLLLYFPVTDDGDLIDHGTLGNDGIIEGTDVSPVNRSTSPANIG